ncbi:hypothetical protein GCM10010266_71560 [Streptomyces griseomycini]|nr:hypothetical protein GCM10010266_71560 [Streptomyces griseomycini]
MTVMTQHMAQMSVEEFEELAAHVAKELKGYADRRPVTSSCPSAAAPPAPPRPAPPRAP